VGIHGPTLSTHSAKRSASSSRHSCDADSLSRCARVPIGDLSVKRAAQCLILVGHVSRGRVECARYTEVWRARFAFRKCVGTLPGEKALVLDECLSGGERHVDCRRIQAELSRMLTNTNLSGALCPFECGPGIVGRTVRSIRALSRWKAEQSRFRNDRKAALKKQQVTTRWGV
jgi:hypothetical protein